VHGNLYCNCWEAVGVGGGKSVDGGCKYRIMGDFTAANCGAQAAYTDYTAFWIRSLPPPDDTFMSCRDALEQGHTETGNYDIYMDGAVYSMYCDFDTSDGPWVLTFIQKNDNNGDSAPDFFPNLKGGSSSKFPNKLVMPAGVDASGGASITLRDKVFKKGDIKFGNKKGWRATGYNHPHTKVMDVFSDSNFNNANPLYCWASGCANTFSSSCSNSDCGSAKALMAYGPYSKGSTVTVYVHGNQFCNCWEVVGVGGGKSGDGGCKYRIVGDFTSSHCGAQAAYTDYTAFWVKF